MSTFQSYNYINTPSYLGRYSLDTIYQHKSSSLDHHRVLVIFIFIFNSYSSISGSSLDLDRSHWIQIITGSRSSSLDLDNLLIWIITGYHHQIWIITAGSRSSLNMDHHCWIWIITRSGSSLLDLDHHSIWISQIHHNQIWIITRYGSPLVIIICAISLFFSSQEVLQIHPFFMLVVGLASMQVFFQHLYMTLSQNGPPNTYI